MTDIYDNAERCHEVLSRMVTNREGCTWGHPLFKAMRDFQRRHNGILPDDLRQLWDRVRLPETPDAPIHYHDGVERMKIWFEEEYQLGDLYDSTYSDGGDEESSVVDGIKFGDWQTEVEEGMGSGEESDPSVPSDPSGSTGSEAAD